MMVIVLIIFCLALLLYIVRLQCIIKDRNEWEKQKLEEWKVLCKFLENNNSVHEIKVFLDSNNYKKIAVCGLNRMGKDIYTKLANEGVYIEYGVDLCEAGIDFPIDVYNPKDMLPEVDLFLVIDGDKELFDILQHKQDVKLIHIQDIL